MNDFNRELNEAIKEVHTSGIGGVLRLADHTVLYIMDDENVEVTVFDMFQKTQARYSTGVESFQAALNIAMFGEEGLEQMLRTPFKRIYSVAEYDMTKTEIRWIP